MRRIDCRLSVDRGPTGGGPARFVRTTDGRIRLEIKQIVFFPFTLDPFRTIVDLVEIAVR